jgi:hypothetical protein
MNSGVAAFAFPQGEPAGGHPARHRWNDALRQAPIPIARQQRQTLDLLELRIQPRISQESFHVPIP